MATTDTPFPPDPEPRIDITPTPDVPQEDLSQPVPLGEPEDEGKILHKED